MAISSPGSDFRWDLVTNTEDFGVVEVVAPRAVYGRRACRARSPALASPITGILPGACDLFHAHRRAQRRLDRPVATAGSRSPASISILQSGQYWLRQRRRWHRQTEFLVLNVTLPNEAALAGVMDLAATGILVKGVRIEGSPAARRPPRSTSSASATWWRPRSRRRGRRLQPVPRLRQDRAGHHE